MAAVDTNRRDQHPAAGGPGGSFIGNVSTLDSKSKRTNVTVTVQQIQSSNGKYKMTVTPDGNIVIQQGYETVWSSNTAGMGKGPYKLALQSIGNLVLYDTAGSGATVWVSNSERDAGPGPYVLAMQDAGKLVLLNSDCKTLWSSPAPVSALERAAAAAAAAAAQAAKATQDLLAAEAAKQQAAAAKKAADEAAARKAAADAAAKKAAEEAAAEKKAAEEAAAAEAARLAAIAEKKQAAAKAEQEATAEAASKAEAAAAAESKATAAAEAVAKAEEALAAAAAAKEEADAAAAAAKAECEAAAAAAAAAQAAKEELEAVGGGSFRGWATSKAENVEIREVTSPNGQFKFGIQKSGDIGVYKKDGEKVWSCEFDGKVIGPYKLVLHASGNVAAYHAEAEAAYWESGTGYDTDAEGPVRVELRNDGVLVIVDGDGKSLWTNKAADAAKGMASKCGAPPAAGGGGCYVGWVSSGGGGADATFHELASFNGVFKLVLQDDCNVVLYKNKTQAIWASNSMNAAKGKGPFQLKLHTDGNLAAYDRDSTMFWSSSTSAGERQGPFRLELENAGNLVIYRGDSKPIWSTNTNCGVN